MRLVLAVKDYIKNELACSVQVLQELDASRVSGSLRKLLSQYRVIKEDCKRRAVVQQRAIQSAVAHVVVMVDSKFVATIIVIIVVIVA